MRVSAAWLLLLARRVVGSAPAPAALAYLQQESAAVSAAQQQVRQLLLQRRIPVGLAPLAASALRRRQSSSRAPRVALSGPGNELTCRVSLARVPEGRKCVAPCGCKGSQRWVQFSELNRLRRLEPQQWTVCQTCRERFDYSMVRAHGGVKGNLLSLALDRLAVLRTLAALLLLAAYAALRLDRVLLRMLTSRALWQLYPKWSRITRLPLVLKLWFGKIGLDYAHDAYLALERRLVGALAEAETAIVEPLLPVSAPDADEDEEQEQGVDA